MGWSNLVSGSLQNVYRLNPNLSAVESSPGDYSRRGSYFGGANDQGRYGPSRRQSYIDGYQGYQAAEYYPYSNHQNQRSSRSRPRVSRRPTDQSANGQYSGQYGYDRYQLAQGSYDNITAGSGQTEPYGNSTDPSSVNSSIDHFQQQQQQQLMMKQKQRMQENGYPGQARMSQPKHVFGAPVADPNSGGPVGGPVGGSVKGAAAAAAAAPQNSRRHLRKSNLSEVSMGESKRKSWFKRAFTKS